MNKSAPNAAPMPLWGDSQEVYLCRLWVVTAYEQGSNHLAGFADACQVCWRAFGVPYVLLERRLYTEPLRERPQQPLH